jgi:lipid-binding SYLF domain-containing protein
MRTVKKNHFYTLRAFSIVMLLLAFVLQGNMQTAFADVKEERAEIRAAVKETLTELYRVQPSAKKVVTTAAGYAVFNNFGTKIFLVGGGGGKGIAKSNKTKKETFMKMLELQTGIGLGVKKFSVIFVFETEQLLNGFVNQGWEFGGQATAAAKMEDEGGSLQGAMSVSPGVWMFQLTDAGLAAELTVKGTKYYKDDDLN